ncbi:VOC family protein [Micromonospora sp. WMMD998]|uniref:VOC family protein n=1 Tax=Micromonospora sp. WMMD998 TaxID=3016092 RepID=UPI002499F798|nr:VOC family protein [Micromonospora sp. WMMD998]WFE37918.1 VOC family protein [Micromonospora sp. WMMD998]
MNGVEPGTPCWTDLATPGLEDARRFYPKLFGWTGRISTVPDAEGYTVFLKDGRAVAGAGPPATPDQVPIWSTYVATDDTDLVATRVEAAGGQVLVSPFDVSGQGRMAVLADPAGAVFSVWQPMAMRGAELFNAPGAMCWNELVTPDPDGAREFYALVFGWHAEERTAGPIPYVGWRCGARIVAGMLPPAEPLPADLPAYWTVYFAVEDTDATAARAAELGGTILVPPRDNPAGRAAALRDPQGALFSISTLR